MKMDEKRIWLPYRTTEPDRLTKYFEEMAAQGWYPEKVGQYTAKFHQGKPRQLRYCIDFTDVKNDEKELRRYTTLCADYGWRFRLKSSDGWLLFSSKDLNAQPLQTDPVLAARNFQKFFRRCFWNDSGFTLFWLLWAFLDLGFNIDRKIRVISCWNTMLEFYFVFLLLLLLLFSLGNAIGNLRGYFASKKAIQNQEILPKISEKTILRRIRHRKILLWTAGLTLAASLGYDIWAGNIRPVWEQWASLIIGGAVFAGGFFLKKEWLDKMARKVAWGVGALFLVLGIVFSYPLYRMEPFPFTENDPVILVEELLPGAELHQNQCEYGHTPLYERWEVYQSGSIPVSENMSDGTTIIYIAYRASNEAIARQLYQEEVETNLSIFHDMEQISLGWPVEEACQLGRSHLLLRDGNCVISMSLWDRTAEELQPLLLEKLEQLKQS